MKFGQLINYNMRKFFIEDLVPDPSLKNKN